MGSNYDNLRFFIAEILLEPNAVGIILEIWECLTDLGVIWRVGIRREFLSIAEPYINTCRTLHLVHISHIIYGGLDQSLTKLRLAYRSLLI